jgi:hypothetical protein
MRALALSLLFSLASLGCNEDAEEGPLACARATAGDACSFDEPCVEVVDHVDGRCGMITTTCEAGRVVMDDETVECSDTDLGAADAGE